MASPFQDVREDFLYEGKPRMEEAVFYARRAESELADGSPQAAMVYAQLSTTAAILTIAAPREETETSG